MAVSRFATNNLVKEHDIYVKFLQMRDNLIKKHGLTNIKEFIPGKYGLCNRLDNTMSKTAISRCLSKWHCIDLSYNIWCRLVEGYTVQVSSNPYKKIVNVPESIIKMFKAQTEQAISEAKCDYNTRLPHRQATYDGCRYLAMYWTYLDIVKDDETQRYYPGTETRKIAAKVFGYEDGENPFQMNGIYWNWGTDEEEEQPVEEKTEVNDDILNTPIRNLNFTIRTFNCLYRSKILTLGDICMKSQRQLLKVRNLGRNSLNEIKDKLAEYDYYYMDLDSNAQKAHPEEGSVVDICKQVAEEMTENKVENEQKTLLDMRKEYIRLKLAYDDAANRLSELSTRYEILLKEKMDLENYNSRLKDDVNNLRDTNRGLEARLNGCDPYKMDTIGLVKLIISHMNKDKMDWLFLTLDGMTIDIHKKAEIENGRMSYTIRTREE